MKIKMNIKINARDLPKQRNPIAVAARNMRGGSHEKPYKTQRVKDKIALRKAAW
jgi:hypothetical protein